MSVRTYIEALFIRISEAMSSYSFPTTYLLPHVFICLLIYLLTNIYQPIEHERQPHALFLSFLLCNFGVFLISSFLSTHLHPDRAAAFQIVMKPYWTFKKKETA